LRSEASHLLALGRLELGSSPSAATAYALASLELADGALARELAVEALGRGPSARVLQDEKSVWNAAFTPDGSRVVVAGVDRRLSVFAEDGSVVARSEPVPDSLRLRGLTPDGRHALTLEG